MNAKTYQITKEKLSITIFTLSIYIKIKNYDEYIIRLAKKYFMSLRSFVKHVTSP